VTDLRGVTGGVDYWITGLLDYRMSGRDGQSSTKVEKMKFAVETRLHTYVDLVYSPLLTDSQFNGKMI